MVLVKPRIERPTTNVTELPETQPRTPRQRFRAQIQEEIKQAALHQLARC